MTSRYASLSRDELARQVPELLLIGQLIDRSGMAWCVQEFGRKEMLQIAIYTMRDRWHGEFHLDFCGALMAVEPMGEDYVRGMYHDIEGPTFDATAVATNPKGSGAADPPGSPSSSASISSSCVVAARIQRTMSSAGMPLTGGTIRRG
jgi:hypothetical protein